MLADAVRQEGGVERAAVAVVTGAAGFIGSHLVDALLARGSRVIGIDNFLRGTRANLDAAFARGGFELLEADLADMAACDSVAGAIAARLGAGGVGQLWHLAANSDIPAGVADLDVDLRQTFMTTVGSLWLARALGVREFYFTSTSAVYGERAGLIGEDAPMRPISNYGAMKLAGEAAISAAAESYLERARVFRLPNVVGARSTHGLIYDMRAKLAVLHGDMRAKLEVLHGDMRAKLEVLHGDMRVEVAGSPLSLEVLGDGTQRKQYLHVGELIEAMLFVAERAEGKFACFNVGPWEDEGITVRRIVEIILETAGSGAAAVYTGGDRGWVGDVPRFAYSVEKLAGLGWKARGSSEGAIRLACEELLVPQKRARLETVSN